jgi:hypothetical protein
MNGFVPVYCGTTETCASYLCTKTCQPSCPFGYYCNLATRTCLERPIFTQNSIITACTQVSNCGIASNYSRTLNQCDRCADNFAFEIKNTTDAGGNPVLNQVSYTTCIAAPLSCQTAVIVTESPLTTACFACYPGYSMVAGYCFMNLNNCTFVNATGYCMACTYTYFEEYQIITDGIFQTGSCVAFVAGTSQPASTPYSGAADVNCAYYSYFYATSVVSRSVLLNQGVNFCVQCKTGFFLNSVSACLPINIANCATYDVASTNVVIVCAACNIGYRLDGTRTSCILNVPPTGQETLNCLFYDASFNCTLCAESYVLGKSGPSNWNQRFFCYLNSTTDPYCTTVNATYFLSEGRVSCNQCGLINGAITYPFRTSSPVFTCLGISTITNCVVHNDTYITNNMNCLMCIPSFFVNAATNRCVQRTAYPIDRCVAYSNTSDTCATFLSTTTATVTVTAPLPLADQILVNSPPILPLGTVLVDYKGWIMGCQVYSDNQTCAQCFPPRYLDPFGFDYNNKCPMAPTVIPYCAIYKSSGVDCSQCQVGYMLINGACILIQAINCATYASPSMCATCPSSYPILNNGNCEIDYQNPWCLEWEPSNVAGSFECVTCLQNYYPNDSGICQRVRNSVRNCLYYQYDGLCKTCKSGFYLQFDSKRCLVNPDWDSNCRDFQYGTECAVCEFGHVIVNKTCTACTTDASCMYCDPSKLSTCLICRFGFQMTDAGTCVANPNFVNGTQFFFDYKWMSGSGISEAASATSIDDESTSRASAIAHILTCFLATLLLFILTPSLI